MTTNIVWLPEPEEHDYPAAQDYLELVLYDMQVVVLMRRLHTAGIVQKKAKDIIRASGLPYLGKDNAHVAKDLRRIALGRPLSPILLVRHEGQLIIADGYHRVSAVYVTNEDAEVPCKLV